MKSLIKKISGWAIIVASLAALLYFYLVQNNIVLSFISVFLIIIGVMVKDSATDEEFNKSSPSLKRISNTNGINFEQLKEDFMAVEGPIGKPWIGRAAWNVKNSLVFGPTDKNELLYIYYKGKKCYISGVGMENIKNATNVKQAYTFSGKSLVNTGYKTVKNYFETGIVTWQQI